MLLCLETRHQYIQLEEDSLKQMWLQQFKGQENDYSSPVAKLRKIRDSDIDFVCMYFNIE